MKSQTNNSTNPSNDSQSEGYELVAAITAGGLLLIAWITGFISRTPEWIPSGSDWSAFAVGLFFTGADVVRSLRKGKFAIDFLMLVAAIGAASIGKVGEAALLLFLFNLGHALEHYSVGRAKAAIKALARLAPQTALVRRDGKESELPVEELNLGDRVIIKPHERITADGIIVSGRSAVDQSPVTGESVPVEKEAVAAEVEESRAPASAKVFAGTINGSGALEISVTRLASDSVVARLVRLVTEAETRRSPTQEFTARFERWFVPAVIGFVVLISFAWLVKDEPFTASFYRAMAVLVAASPCALAIATPSAVLSAIACAGRAGVLVKGGEPLENLGRLRAFAFDKTGTLTEGKPQLVEVLTMPEISEDRLLRSVVAIERQSDHPLASAVVRGGRSRLGEDSTLPEVRQVESLPGRGIRAELDRAAAWVGNAKLFSESGGESLPKEVREKVDQLQQRGCTIMIARVGDTFLGVLGLMDTARPAALTTIRELRNLGVSRFVMISGDNQRVAEAVAGQVGIEEAHGALLPEDKVSVIRTFDREEGVAMVGDGVNDAPAMANATVSIAMGAAGSDVALETADVALMADDLTKLPFALGLGRASARIIRQNLWFSLGMVAALVPAALAGLGIGPAVALHEGSTVFVVINALRLLRYSVPEEDAKTEMAIEPRTVWTGTSN